MAELLDHDPGRLCWVHISAGLGRLLRPFDFSETVRRLKAGEEIARPGLTRDAAGGDRVPARWRHPQHVDRQLHSSTDQAGGWCKKKGAQFRLARLMDRSPFVELKRQAKRKGPRKGEGLGGALTRRSGGFQKGRLVTPAAICRRVDGIPLAIELAAAANT